jgi:hypothetical protein
VTGTALSPVPLLRPLALIVVLSGAVASIAFMFRAMRYQPSMLLLLFFTIWVLSPFCGAVLTHILSKRWSLLAGPALYLVMLVFTLGSLLIYWSVAFRHVAMKVGFAFIVVPFASWLLLAATAAVLALTDRARSRA